MKTRMKNRLLTHLLAHLKYAFASLALLAGLGLASPAQAENSTQPQASSQQVVIVLLAWQRVGAPISMEA
jgi:hypothetical protein